MTPSKKTQMLLATIGGVVLVLIVYHYLPGLDPHVVQWAISGITGTGIGGVLGQGFADGMSKGLTSSQGKGIIALEQERFDTGKMVAEALNAVTKGQAPGNAVSGSGQTATTPSQPSGPSAGTPSPSTG